MKKKKDKQIYIVSNGVALVPLSNCDDHAIIEDCDLELIRQRNWYLDHKGYAKTKFPGDIKMLMHRHILQMPRREGSVDHINRNRLDNRRSNLRVASVQLQNINRNIQRNNKSGIKGVYLRVRIIRNNEYRYWVATWMAREVGYFKTKEEAAQARALLEKDYGII